MILYRKMHIALFTIFFEMLEQEEGGGEREEIFTDSSPGGSNCQGRARPKSLEPSSAVFSMLSAAAGSWIPSRIAGTWAELVTRMGCQCHGCWLHLLCHNSDPWFNLLCCKLSKMRLLNYIWVLYYMYDFWWFLSFFNLHLKDNLKFDHSISHLIFLF